MTRDEFVEKWKDTLPNGVLTNLMKDLLSIIEQEGQEDALRDSRQKTRTVGFGFTPNLRGTELRNDEAGGAFPSGQG